MTAPGPEDDQRRKKYARTGTRDDQGASGQVVADTLRDAGLPVATRRPEQVTGVDGYDAVLLGSAVYAGRWLAQARSFAERFATELANRPTWVFSSGSLGHPSLPESDASEPIVIARRLAARDCRTFAGRLERAKLGLFERAMITAVKAPQGDFRDFDEIRRWADDIALTLLAEGANRDLQHSILPSR